MNTKLKCLLLDDELPGLKYLKMLCEQIEELEVVKAFSQVEKFLEEQSVLEYDLCIMDIEMPGMDGLSVANLIKGKSVIFTTAYREYAAEAFDLDAVDYIRKPVTKERLQAAVKKAADRLHRSRSVRNFMQLNTDKGKTLLFFDQVALISASETDSRDKKVLLHDGKTILLKNISFGKLLQSLPVDEFARVNKKDVIALRFVQFFTHNEIVTCLLQSSGKPVTLTLGGAHRENFLKKVKV